MAADADIERISQLVTELADALPPRERRDAPNPVLIARAWVRARAARDQVLGADLFHEPAWSILLDLFIARSEGKPVSVSSACVAAGTPMTTSLRWISLLVQRGLLERTADPKDRRRVFVRASDKGMARIEAALVSASNSDSRLGLGRLRLL